jgi:glutathione peroxidase
MTNLLELPVTTLQGELTTFGALADGRVALVVNVASKCGFTRQYAGLEELQKQYADRGFTVLGFPCNQFGGQEPGSAAEIQEFCSLTYGVTFPMSDKIDVNGPDRDPVYGELVAAGDDIKWNFEKFVVAADGTVAGRFNSKVEPDAPELVGLVESLLPQ